MSHRRLPIRAGVLVLVLLSVFSAVPAASALAAAGDASLVSSWTDPSGRPGTRLVLLAPGVETVLPWTGGAGETELTLLPPGLARVELRTNEGEVAGAWDLPLAANAITRATLDFAADALRIDPVRAEPFGNERVWSPAELAVLPGNGREMLTGFTPDLNSGATAGADRAAFDRVELRDLARQRVSAPLWDRAPSVAQTPLGAVSATQSARRTHWLLGRAQRGPRLDLAFSAGGGDELIGQVGVGYRRAPDSGPSFLRGLGIVDLEGRLQGESTNDAGPLSFSRDPLEGNDRSAVIAWIRATARPGGWSSASDAETSSPSGAVAPGLLRIDVYAHGSDAQHYLQEFGDAPDHAPREVRGQAMARADYDFSLPFGATSIGVGWRRDVTEIGDGEAFDVFDDYRSTTGSTEAGPFDLAWQGDDPNTPQSEAHLWDYYVRTAVRRVDLRGEARVDALGGSLRPMRLGAELSRDAFRIYELLLPSDIPRQRGYGLAHYLGYSEDGDDREGSPGHETPNPSHLALFAAQPLRWGSVDLEAGLRLERFAPDARPLGDPDRPVGIAGGNGEARLGDEEVSQALLPAIGLHTTVGKTHIWADAASHWTVPPYQAVYFSNSLLENLVASAQVNQLRVGRDYVFGSPDLAPEREDAAHLGFFAPLRERLSLRVALLGARTADTWVVRPISLGPDTLHVYDNRGERRGLSGQAELIWDRGPRSRVRLLYAAGRVETDVIEPSDLLLVDSEGAVPSAGRRQSRATAPLRVDDGADRDFFPSFRDRTHRLALVYVTHVDPESGGLSSLLPDWDVAVTARLASGRPYTPVFVRAEGLVATIESEARPVTPAELNSERMPWTGQLDLGLRRAMSIFGRALTLTIEGRNLTDQRNAAKVYEATGEPDDDGWLETPAGRAAVASQGDAFARAYRDRVDDPLHLDDGLTARAALTVSF